jgi:GxxExxY protein
MNTDGKTLLLKDEVFQIRACAIGVLNTLGHGLVEKPYENALGVEFSLRNIPCQQQPVFDVMYKTQKNRPVRARPHRFQFDGGRC